jgi:hypothetical protein
MTSLADERRNSVPFGNCAIERLWFLQNACLPIGVIRKVEVDVAGHFIGVPSVAEKPR